MSDAEHIELLERHVALQEEMLRASQATAVELDRFLERLLSVQLDDTPRWRWLARLRIKRRLSALGTA